MKASRFLLLCFMATACIPASGVSPAQTAIQNPDPQLSGPSPSSPFVARETPRSASATAPMPAMSKKTKTWLLIGAGVLAAVLVIVLVSGNGYSTGGY